MSEYQGSASAKSPSDVHAMESGFFNKYAIDEADPRKGDPADPKTVILHEAYLDASRDIGNIETAVDNLPLCDSHPWIKSPNINIKHKPDNLIKRQDSN